ncbi:MFS transporter [Streptomyces sp. NPDC058525]|uniref:MFS transporter n=1 Tax=unclassified Streptomyces TaxID=2593676 RepID=UPI003650E2CD
MTAGGGGVRRIRRTYLLVSGLDWFADMALTVTSVLLLQSLGMSGPGVFAVIAAVWIVEGLSEIPTGIAADLLGRRSAVAVSFLLRAVGYSALFFSDSIPVAVAGTLLAALGGTFSSGALEAWAVDETERTDPGGLDRMFTQGRIADNTGLVLGTLTGAWLGTFDLALPQLAAGLACLAGTALALARMTEARPSPADGRFAARLRESTTDVLAGARITLSGDRILLALIVGAAVLGLCRGVPGVQWTVVFESAAGGSLLLLALMRCAGSLLEIPLLGWVLRFQKRNTGARRTVIAGGALVAGLALTGAALLPGALGPAVAFVAFTTAFGMCMPGIRAALNERIGGEHRATVLSVAALFTNLFTGGALVLMGVVVGDLAAVSVAWPLAALVFAATGLGMAFLAGRPAPAPAPVAPAPQSRSAVDVEEVA